MFGEDHSQRMIFGDECCSWVEQRFQRCVYDTLGHTNCGNFLSIPHPSPSSSNLLIPRQI